VAIRYEIDSAAGLVRVTVSGDVTSAEIFDYYAAVAADPALRPGLSIFADCRAVTSVPPFAELSVAANVQARAPADLRPSRAAVLVSSGWLFGIVRQFAALAERGGILVVPFYDRDDAQQWLSREGGPAPAERLSRGEPGSADERPR
jgi:hypothetical protein